MGFEEEFEKILNIKQNLTILENEKIIKDKIQEIMKKYNDKIEMNKNLNKRLDNSKTIKEISETIKMANRDIELYESFINELKEIIK